MYYAIFCTDKADSLSIRLENRPAHLDHLTAQGAKLIFAGPTLDGDEKPNGSLIVLEADSQAAAEAFADGDPYAKAGLFESVVIRPWKQVFPQA